MINKVKNLLLMLLILSATYTLAQNAITRADRIKAVTLDNEFERRNQPGDEYFFPNPLTLNGKSLDYATFSIASRGRLNVMSGNPVSAEAVRIPFRIYLRRNGSAISAGASDPDRAVADIEVATVLMHARPGDQLVIEPVNKSDWRAKRIIKVVRYFDWFAIAIGRRDNC